MRKSVATVIILAALAVASSTMGQAAQQVPLPGNSIPQFVDPLPSLPVVDGTQSLKLTMCEFKSRVLPTGTFAPGSVPETWTWGYIVGDTCPSPTTTRSSYLGPVIVAQRGIPTEVTYVNNLGSAATTNVLAYKNSVDQTLHWADPLGREENHCAEEAMMMPGMPPMGECAENYSDSIPAVVHLHGGDVPPQIDGGPDAWFTSDGMYQGHGYYTKPGSEGLGGNTAVYRYPNNQEMSTIWFHDHTLGATRLNVYAGLAGGYVVVDPADTSIPANLPPITPLVVQDRSFDKNGQLFFPAAVPYIPNPDHPYWVPEFLGDTIAVNGKVWPYFNVEPRRYRFVFVNGSNARTYEMYLADQATKAMGPAMWQIGTDGAMLDRPVLIDPNSGGGLSKLVLMPGERADVIIDFAGLPPGTSLLLRNVAKAPYPRGATPSGNTMGRVMQFRVIAGSGAPDTSFDPSTGAPLRAPMVRLVNPVTGTLATGVTAQVKRQMTLNEVMGMPMTVNGITYPGGPLEILVNNTKWNGKMPDGTIRPDFTPISVDGITTGYSELPKEGETEIWEIINLTVDAHPIHLHLVQFQLMNRQNFDTKKYPAAYATAYGGVVVDSYGPPLDYNVPNADGAVGGNPAVGGFLKGPLKPPNANEAGWKDTVTMLPGQVTRIAVRWAPTVYPATTPPAEAHYDFDPNGGHGYVWHCHIVDHEDNEMMRPTNVIPIPGAVRTYIEGVDY
jgi:FtsP/CotA-like multicopper oxidase with cupredoxin domain